MGRPRGQFFLLLSVLSLVLSGCGGFNGILAPTLSSINPTTIAAGSDAFTLTATGANFTGGTVILWDGASLPTTVTSATQLTAKVTAAQIASAGAVSIRVMKSDSTTSDALTLTITGGSPGGTFSLTSISPAAVAAGSPAFTLTATGVGFVSGAAITLNGTAITTTFDSATQLHAMVPASDVAAAAAITVGVTNPDKSQTNTLPLTVISASGGGLGPAPTLTAISPNTSPNSISSALTLTATGTNFVSGSKIMWNGVAMTTTFSSSTKLTASIPTKYVNVPSSAFDPTTGVATANVFVLNPDSTVSGELPFTITASASNTPVLNSIYNSVDQTNHSAVNSPGFTLTLCGSLFANGAVAYFGTTALTTTAVAPAASPCPSTVPQQITATVPASLLTAVAQVPVTVKNPSSAASNPIPYYVGMNIYFDESADVAWDSRYNLLYVSKPSTAQHNADTVMAFSPTHLTDVAAIWIYKLPTGSNPDRLAMSADGRYLYVGLDGAGTVQQLSLTSASSAPSAGTSISLGSDTQYGNYYALDLQVSPSSNTTIAVARGVPPSSGSPSRARGGVAVYDGAAQRANVVGPSATPSADALLDTLQWSADGNTIYAANNENASADLYQLPVTASGVTLPVGNDHAGIFNIPNLFIHLDAASGWLYGDDGTVLDAATATVKGNTLANGIMTPDHATSTAFYVAHPSADPNLLEYFVLSYDLTSLAPGPSLDLFQVQGIPQHLIRWNNSSDGSKGLAFTTEKFNCLYSPCNVGDGRLYVIDLPLP